MKKNIFIGLFLSLCFSGAFAQEPDIDKIYEQAKKHLVNLIHINTSQPQPDETRAARYLYIELNKHGLDWDFLSPHKGAANLISLIKGSDPQAKPLLLISHLDTQAAAQGWTYPPFKATVENGRIYGLGSTDAKNYTAMHLALFAHIKDSGQTPKRDIIFLASSGEEAGSGTGVKWLGETRRDKIASSYALNEGGGIIKDAPTGGTLLFAEAGSKMYMDIKITASGEAAHSSMPVQANAVYRLSQALARLQEFNPPFRLTDAAREFFSRIAPLQDKDGQTTVKLLLSGTPQEQEMAAEIMAKDPFFRTQLKDTLTPVNISSGADTGAAAAEASAVINARLLPGTDPDVFFEELKAFLGEEEHLSLEILERPQTPFPQPMDGTDELFEALSHTARRMWPGAVTVPGMNPASGDGEFLRRLGIVTYGLGPTMNAQEHAAAAHTADEYISEEDFKEQIKFFTAVVYKFALGQDILPPAENMQKKEQEE